MGTADTLQNLRTKDLLLTAGGTKYIKKIPSGDFACGWLTRATDVANMLAVLFSSILLLSFFPIIFYLI